MTRFQINDRQNDRSASCVGGMLNRSSNGGPSVEAMHRKKSYRARGCRGGASRKGRKKQTLTSESRQDEENDPHRLNVNSDQRQFNGDSLGSMRHWKIANASDILDTETESSTSDVPDESKSNNRRVHPQRNHRSQSLAPSGSGTKIYQGFSGSASDADIEVELLDRSQHPVHFGRGTMPILPMHYDDTQHAMLMPSANCVREISAISMPEKRSDTSEGQSAVGGFSFFCISPCSFLSGKREKMERSTF
jgi:hypothetical protein